MEVATISEPNADFGDGDGSQCLTYTHQDFLIIETLPHPSKFCMWVLYAGLSIDRNLHNYLEA